LQGADARLLQVVDFRLREGAERAGGALACRPGCTECCIGPFPISRLDAWRLRRGLEELSRQEPGTADAILARARDAVRVFSQSFPGDAACGLLDGDDTAEDAFFDAHAALPCPALDSRDGTCALYAFRPLTCRTYGPPVLIGAEPLPPCRLCFQGSSPGEIERCRVEPDPTGMEDAIIEGMTVFDGEDRETVIAYALAGGRARSPGKKSE
jgi:Fe-S-cluster containining protein